MLSVLDQTTRRSLLCASLLLLLCADAQPLSGAPRPVVGAGVVGAPQWFGEHLESHMRGGGYWIADNQAYVSDSEPIDSYGLQWRWGAGRKSLHGRLFAVAGGRETGTVAELRVLWHPGDREAQVFQYGSDGTLSIGLLEPMTEGGMRLEQVSHAPDGSTRSVRHEETLESDGARISTAFIETPSGWAAERTYVWLPRAE